MSSPNIRTRWFVLLLLATITLVGLFVWPTFWRYDVEWHSAKGVKGSFTIPIRFSRMDGRRGMA